MDLETCRVKNQGGKDWDVFKGMGRWCTANSSSDTKYCCNQGGCFRKCTEMYKKKPGLKSACDLSCHTNRNQSMVPEFIWDLKVYVDELIYEMKQDPIYYAMLAAIIILVLVNVALIIYHRKKLMSAITKIVARIKGFFVVRKVTHPCIETTSAPLSYGAQIKGFFMVKKGTHPSIKPTSAPLSYGARIEGFFSVKKATHPSINPTSTPICYGV